MFTEAQIAQLAKVEDFLQKINNLKKIAAGEITFGFIQSFKDFLGEGPSGSPARALRDRLFGVDKAPASARSGGSKITGLGVSDLDEQRIKELQKLDTDAARFELKMIEARIDGRRKAEQIMEDFEDQTAKDNIRNAEERARATAQALSGIEDIRAERAGSGAELSLARERAQAAADQARESQSAQDTLAAEQAALRLQKMEQDRLRQQGIDEGTAGIMARARTNQLVGALPTFRDMPAMNMAPVLPSEIKVNNMPTLDAVVAKLDELIRTAGKFGN